MAYDIIISPLKTNLTATYGCALWKFWQPNPSNVFLSRGSTFNLIVEEYLAPTFADGKNFWIDERVIQRGSELTLNCQVDGRPPPHVIWTSNNRNISSNETEPGIYLRDTKTLQVDRAGIFKCFAVNRHGENGRTFDVRYEYEQSYLAVIIGIPSSVVILALVAFLIWWLRHRAINASFKELSAQLKNPCDASVLNAAFFLNDQVNNVPYNRDYEVKRDVFILSTKLIGQGEFGNVFEGELKVNERQNFFVAIKVPKDASNLQSYRALVDELKLMSHIRSHVNVLSLVGACTDDLEKRQLFVLTEFCENGSLKDYLLKNKMKFEGFETNEKGQFLGTPGAVETLLKYAYQAANGMQYLSAQNVIHRDLALRNLLLTATQIVKIADFGMSRCHVSIYRKRLSPNVPVPIFWMALESILNGQYTEKSDVWSFGVVLWEMFSCGETPYSGHDPDEHFMTWLCREANRMRAPKIACDKMYELMLKCWAKDPDARPRFSACKRTIGGALEQKSSSAYQSNLLRLNEAWLDMASCRGSTSGTSESSSHEAAGVINPTFEPLIEEEEIEVGCFLSSVDTKRGIKNFENVETRVEPESVQSRPCVFANAAKDFILNADVSVGTGYAKPC